jgi:hypothetical protein
VKGHYIKWGMSDGHEIQVLNMYLISNGTICQMGYYIECIIMYYKRLTLPNLT